jgi:hypothetical protein
MALSSLGHTNYGSLRHMSHLHLVEGLPQINPPSGVCEGCVMGKHHRESFPKDNSRWASKPLELIHNDICGPMATSSLGGAKYFLTFIDDFSWFLWVYTIKSKDEVFAKFQEFKNLVEAQCKQKIKCLWFDGGGEYIDNAFCQFLCSHGISWQQIVPYTPQQMVWLSKRIGLSWKWPIVCFTLRT